VARKFLPEFDDELAAAAFRRPFERLARVTADIYRRKFAPAYNA